MTDPARMYLDDLMLWSGQNRNADDNRVRFASITAHGNTTNLMLRNIQADVIRDGTGDWAVSHTDEAGHTWDARSDTHTGAMLTLLARMCGLAGEIRGFLPEADDERTGP